MSALIAETIPRFRNVAGVAVAARNIIRAIEQVVSPPRGIVTVEDGFLEYAWIGPVGGHVAAWGTTAIGVVDTIGKIVVACVDDDGTPHRYVIGQAVPDDHCAPALVLDNGWPPLALWTKHSADNVLRAKVGQVNSIPSLVTAAEQSLTFPSQASYSQVFTLSTTGDLREYLVLLRLGSGSPRYVWTSVRFTVNRLTGALTWGAPRTLFSFSQQGYITCHEHGDDPTITMAIGNNPTATIGDVAWVQLDRVSGTIRDDAGAIIGNAYTGAGLPITFASLPKAIDTNETTTALRLLAVSGDHILYATRDKVAKTMRYLLRSRTGPGTYAPDIDLGSPGQKIGEKDASMYIAGGSFATTDPDDTTVLLGRNPAAIGYVERNYDDGAGGRATDIVYMSAEHHVSRPKPIPGAGPYDFVVSDVVSYGQGDNGFTTALANTTFGSYDHDYRLAS